MLCSQLLSLWMKSYGVTIEMKAFTCGVHVPTITVLHTYSIEMSIVGGQGLMWTLTVLCKQVPTFKFVDKSPIFVIFQNKRGVYSWDQVIHYNLFYIVTHNNLLKVSSLKGLSQLILQGGIATLRTWRRWCYIHWLLFCYWALSPWEWERPLRSDILCI